MIAAGENEESLRFPFHLFPWHADTMENEMRFLLSFILLGWEIKNEVFSLPFPINLKYSMHV